jgi:hypothetical protein
MNIGPVIDEPVRGTSPCVNHGPLVVSSGEHVPVSVTKGSRCGTGSSASIHGRVSLRLHKKDVDWQPASSPH